MNCSVYWTSPYGYMVSSTSRQILNPKTCLLYSSSQLNRFDHLRHFIEENLKVVLISSFSVTMYYQVSCQEFSILPLKSP